MAGLEIGSLWEGRPRDRTAILCFHHRGALHERTPATYDPGYCRPPDTQFVHAIPSLPE